MFCALSCCRDERQVNICICCTGKLFFSLFSRLFQTLHSHLIAGKVNAFRAFKFIDHILGQLVIKVIAAQMVITGSCQYFDNAVADFDNGNIECTSAQVINHDLLFIFIIKTIGQSCGCRLVDNTLYIKTGNLTGILCSLSLSIVEVSRYGNNSFADLFTKVAFRICFQFLKNHCGNFLWRIFLIINGYSVIGAHMSLNGRDRLICICHSLTFCRFTDKTFPGLCKGNNGRCCSCAFGICDNYRFSAFHNSYA